MYDRFRELEKPHSLRKKDVVLMATVTSFETLRQPTKSDLRQFAELFRPLYENSSEDARKQAVAALSQCAALPDAVCYFLGTQPIAISAIFLSRAKAISDQTLIAIARSQGPEHAKAIATRENLSTQVIDALTALHDGAAYHKDVADAAEAPQTRAPTPKKAEIAIEHELALPDNRPEEARLAREESLRDELRHLVSLNDPEQEPPRILSGLDPQHEALLVRFARQRELPLFARTLSDAIGASIWLTDRILLDLSGQQLAATLMALGMNVRDIRFVLCRIYPHLGEATEGRTRAHLIVRALDAAACVDRLSAWRRADHYTHSDLTEEEMPTPANQDSIERLARHIARQPQPRRNFGRR